MSRVLQWLIYNRSFCNRVMKSLSTDQVLAETLTGVIGDILPAKNVVSTNFIFQLLVGAFKRNKSGVLKKAS